MGGYNLACKGSRKNAVGCGGRAFRLPLTADTIEDCPNQSPIYAVSCSGVRNLLLSDCCNYPPAGRSVITFSFLRKKGELI